METTKLNSSKQNKNGLKVYLRLLNSLKSYKKSIILAILGVLVIAAADGYIYKSLVPTLVDESFVSKNPDFMIMAPIYIIALFLVRGFAKFLATYNMGFIGRSTVGNFRKKMLSHMMTLPVAFFKNKTAGELLSKINYDAEKLATSISNAVLEVLQGVFTIAALLTVMFLISWKITIIILIMGPVLAIYFRYVSRRMRSYSTSVQDSMAKVTQVSGEVINGYKVIKGFSGKEYEQHRIEESISNNLKSEMKMHFAMASSIPIMQFIGACGLSLLVFLATLKSINLSVGEFSGMIGAMIVLLRPIKQVASVNSTLQQGISAAESIFNLLDEKSEEDLGTLAIKSVEGKVSFYNVWFSYKKKNNIENINEHDKSVIKGVSFDINPGEMVALVGSSGSGKSTIASLLPRFYNVSKGTISIDGIDINNYKLEDLRKQIAFVSQDIMLFNDTIANNIAYGYEDKYSKEQILAAAKKAYVTKFALKMPQGLDTVVGDRGNMLSGGQRQRIAIARAILKNAPILILDEATSALDSESEQYIQSALNEIMVNKTTLVIAHRLSTIENADKILVIENGKVVESGSHKSLINNKSRYASLYNSYNEN